MNSNSSRISGFNTSKRATKIKKATARLLPPGEGQKACLHVLASLCAQRTTAMTSATVATSIVVFSAQTLVLSSRRGFATVSWSILLGNLLTDYLSDFLKFCDRVESEIC